MFPAAQSFIPHTQLTDLHVADHVCSPFLPGTTFAALSLIEAGYEVFANGEASGSSSPFVRDLANERMRQGGVQVVSMFSIMSELMRSWGNTPGAVELMPFLDTYYPAYASVARSFTAASNATA